MGSRIAQQYLPGWISICGNLQLSHLWLLSDFGTELNLTGMWRELLSTGDTKASHQKCSDELYVSPAWHQAPSRVQVGTFHGKSTSSSSCGQCCSIEFSARRNYRREATHVLPRQEVFCILTPVAAAQVEPRYKSPLMGQPKEHEFDWL